jgi:hypothetical protein
LEEKRFAKILLGVTDYLHFTRVRGHPWILVCHPVLNGEKKKKKKQQRETIFVSGFFYDHTYL